jgi:hypothetical protein
MVPKTIVVMGAFPQPRPLEENRESRVNRELFPQL